MDNLQDLYKDLEKYSDFEIGDNDQLFLDTVDKIIEFHSPDSVRIFFEYFDDDDRGWVLESLKGIIKSRSYLDDEQFTLAVLKNLHLLMHKAQNWAVSFFYVLFNAPTCLSTLKDNMHIVKKEYLSKIFDMIYQDSEEHKKVLIELRKNFE